MKTLWLLRHAKSSWDDPSLPDHDRPLKPRGIKAARRIGQLLTQQRCLPELVLCSTAVRAGETLQLVLDAARISVPVEYRESLYHCAPAEFIAALNGVSPTISTVMLVGHNPGLEEFLQQLTNCEEAMPTGCLAQVDIARDDWSRLDENSRGMLVALWRPRDLED